MPKIVKPKEVTVIERNEEEPRRGGVFIGTLNVIQQPLKKRHERFYKESKMHLALDIVLVVLILLLAGFNIYLWQRGPLPIIPALVGTGHKTPGADIENTILNLQAESRYYAFGGEQLGRGPFPIKPGETTSFWVFLKVTNTIHPIDNAHLEGRLAPGVHWTGRVSASSGKGIHFDKNKNEFVWEIGEIPESIGKEKPAYEAAFEVSYTPSAVFEIQSSYHLIEKLELIGLDRVSRNKVQASLGSVMTP